MAISDSIGAGVALAEPAAAHTAPARAARAQSGLLWLVIGLLAWAPLPLASHRPWSWTLLAVAIGGLLLLGCLAALLEPRAVRVPAALWLAGFLFGAVLVWSFLQSEPGLPPALAHPVWSWPLPEAGAVQPLPALATESGRHALLRLMSYGGAFWLAYAVAQDRARARSLFGALIVIGAGYAAFGLLRHFAGWENIFWHVPAPYRGVVSATFVNRNHFATYANLAVIAGLALLLEPLLQRSVRGWRGLTLAVARHLLERRGLLLLAVLLTVVASLLTGSRGGLLSLALALPVLLGIVLHKARLGWRPVALLVLVVALVGCGLLRLGGDLTLQRFEQSLDDADPERGSRVGVWLLSLELIAERPLLGHGHGSFESAFAQVRDERFGVIWDQAHNTYLEHAVELGLPAAGALYGAILLLVGLCLRGVAVRRRDQIFPIAALAATVLVGSHALVDFSIQIPAVALAYATLLGIGCAQSLPTAPSRAAAATAGPAT
jgi:O-antigen ligase